MGLEVDRNRLSWWFPKLMEVIPVEHLPLTSIVPYTGGGDMSSLVDGKYPDGWHEFFANLSAVAKNMGYPIFLRHDLFSGKHGWMETCYVDHPEKLGQHVINIIENWHMANWFASGGDDVWIVREFIPIKEPVLHAFADMPIGRERRCIVKDGFVSQVFPYWPVGAFERNNFGEPSRNLGSIIEVIGGISDVTQEELDIIAPLAADAGRALGGDWTVDFMESERGWILIDCANLSDSWKPNSEDFLAWEGAVRAYESTHPR